ncbi:carbohydrate porin [Hoeflea prorocentri]|uniref:Carbohydrate porin n=1 Tax=Hoeflea prorocentri TaxID=1922333 RepID=A0A9X3ZIN1_9HYPH|nr:carbohydrate porin [Hoeflea prorocentri]MCY6381885.1 carbohydrate porin [Hoeflea prorocentri]MDA5399685.1 carbohydrate porin [Hoeflea prorocentri]
MKGQRNPMSAHLQKLRLRAFASTLVITGLLAGVTASLADINPWIKASQFNPARWDTAGPETATPWLHPGTWTPDQGWGWFSGNPQAPNVLGSWGGLRDDLELMGISFSGAYSGQFAANPIGGQTPDGASWIGSWNFGTFVDFSRLLDIEQRTYFTASFNLGTGNIGLTPNNVGNHFPVQLSSSGEPGPSTRLVHLAVGSQLFNNTTELVGGRIITGEDFATLATACTSVNQGICGNPIAGASSINFPTYPNAVWGGRVKVKPGNSWYAQTGAYLVYPSLGDPSEHGVEFGAPDGSGVLAISEVGVNVGNRASQTGLPGTYKVGGYYDTERLTNLQTGASERNTWGIYAMGEQMLYSMDDSYSRGLWAWLALSYAPPDLNEIMFMAAGGLSYVGPFNSRPEDSLSFIAAMGVFSKHLAGQTAETILEVNYRAQILPAFYVQPDVQFILNPDGKSSIDDAIVVGFSVGSTF